MYFLISAAAFAATVLSFHLLLARSRANPRLFAGDWLAMVAAVFYTAAFSGSFLAMCAAAIARAPTIIIGLIVGIVSAIVIVVAVNYLLHRLRSPVSGTPQVG